MQVLTEKDFYKPIRPPSQFFGNYAFSKAVGERLVCDANEFPPEGADLSRPGGFRTGIIRPGSPIYGGPQDPVLGLLLKQKGPSPTFSAPWMQNWVNSSNVAMAHLLYEQRLLSPQGRALAARPFLVTDAGPPPIFEDYYTLARITVAKNPPVIQYPPPVLLLVLAQLVEWYCVLLWRFPFLNRVFSEPGFPLYWLQPACFSASINLIIDDSAARRSPEQGGLGYKPLCTTMEGMCMQVHNWNETYSKAEGEGK